jgi:phosphonate transport system substrate-binding protein
MKKQRLRGWRIFSLVVVEVIALTLVGAEQGKSPPADWPQIFRFGYVPQAGNDDGKEVYDRMGQLLAREMKIELKMQPMEDYSSVIKGFRDRTLEGAYLGPYSYIEAEELLGVEAVAMELGEDGARGCYSIIITRADSGIRKLEDARGKVLAFSDPKSTTGFLVPALHFIQDLEVTPAKFASRLVFAGSHGEVMEGVFERTYHLGATNDRDFKRTIEADKMKEKDFRILWKSRVIPAGPCCVRRDLPESLKSAFRDALVNLEDESILKGLNIGGYSPVSDLEYNIIRELKKLRK